MARSRPVHLNLAVLDALRGLAALYVMLSHARSFLWIGQRDYAASEHGVGLVFAALSASLTYAHYAVLLFFLLSGLCIHYRQAKWLTASRDLRQGKLFDVASYAWRRVRRLYPMLLVALILTVLFDIVGMRVNPPVYLDRTWYPSPDFSLPTLIGNLFMQGGLAVPVLGDNVPLWSLAWEFWFYALYPVLLWLSFRLRAAAMLAVPTAISIVLLVSPHAFVPHWITDVLTYWIVWAAGAGIAEAYAGRIHLRGLRFLAPVAAAGGIGLVGFLALRHLAPAQGTGTAFEDPVTDLMMSATLAVLLAYMMLELPARIGARVEAVARRLAPLGDVSYSLYVVHFPLLLLISAWWQSRYGHVPVGVELAVPGVLFTLGFAWCCWYCVERHCVSTTSASRVSRSAATRSALPQEDAPRVPVLVVADDAA